MDTHDDANRNGADFDQPEHVKRVLDEYGDLIEKLRKLSGFLITDDFLKLDGPERALLLEQHVSMIGYASALRSRLDLYCA